MSKGKQAKIAANFFNLVKLLPTSNMVTNFATEFCVILDDFISVVSLFNAKKQENFSLLPAARNSQTQKKMKKIKMNKIFNIKRKFF